MNFSIDQIQRMIFIIRGQKVMLDSDLAKLYGVQTKVLNQAVKRNINRFPADFMFECNSKELGDLRSQIVTANPVSNLNHKSRVHPMLFTESGVAMLSGVLKSDRAVAVNISIMRIFIRLRSYYMMEREIQSELEKSKEDTNKIFKIVFERLDNLENGLPILSNDRKKIGLKAKKSK